MSHRSTTGHTQRTFLSLPPFAVQTLILALLCPSRLLTIVREEGPAALYKGFVPKVLRLAPGGGVLLLVVEFTLNVFRQGRSTRINVTE